MEGQDAGGFGFVVREVISGPRELAEVAPAQAVTLACLAGSDGEGQFWCGQLEQPVADCVGPQERDIGPSVNPNAKLSRRLWATELDVFIPCKTGRPKTVGLNDGLGA